MIKDRETLVKYLPWISAPVMLLLVVGVWQFAVSVIGVSKFILPAPVDVASALATLVTGVSVWTDIRVTLTEVVVGFVIALISGVLVGSVLGRVLWLARAMQPAMVAFQVVPK